MPEIAVNQLPEAWRGLAIKARQAADRGEPKLAAELCAQVLQAIPTCLAMRELQLTSRLQMRGTRGKGLPAKLTGWMRLSGGKPKSSPATLEEADATLVIDYFGTAGWLQLAAAARRLGLPETEGFARQALVRIDPQNREAVGELARWFIDREQPVQALAVLREGLVQHPGDAELEALQQEAAVAQTMTEGNWEGEGDFRSKLRRSGLD